MTYLTVPFFTYVFAVLPVWPLYLAMVAIAMYMLLFLEKFNPRTFVFWVAIVFVLPFLGFLIYLIWGCTVFIRREGRRRNEENKEFFEGESDDIPETLHRIASPMRAAGSDIYTSGNKANFHWFVEEAESCMKGLASAKEYIHVELNRIPKSPNSMAMMEIIRRKASEGIDVRMILGTFGFGRTSCVRSLRKAGAEIITFHNKAYTALSPRAANRGRRDFIVIDGRLAIIGHEAFAELEGKIVNRLARRFAADWFHSTKERLDVSDEGSCIGSDGAMMISSGPDYVRAPVLSAFASLLTEAKNRVYMTFPYMVTGDEIYGFIREAALAGKDVRLAIPAVTHRWYQKWNSLAAVNSLMKSGVKVYFVDKPSRRCVMVADGSMCIVGSATMNTRSPYLDYGESALIVSEHAGSVAEKDFLRYIDGSGECVSEDYEDRSFGDKLRIACARLMMFLN